MQTIKVQQPINLKVVRFELDFSTLAPQEKKDEEERKPKTIRVPRVNFEKKHVAIPPPPPINNANVKAKSPNELIEDLLDDIYTERQYWACSSNVEYSRGSFSVGSEASSQNYYEEDGEAIQRTFLEDLDIQDITENLEVLEERLQWTGKRLAKHLRKRDRLRRQQKRLCAAFTVMLRHITGDTNARFGALPGEGAGAGEGGFAEWLHAMRLVARLPAGVPQHFRRRLWLSLADRYLSSRHVDWPAAERACFRGTALPDDAELGAQILKDLHRTGCSLFCGSEGRENQAMLRRVLLAYARWNKDVGYCQGFNMLAAIILEVMEKAESDSLKVMIYLVEAVLPEGYFADDLRGLSADMAAFRDLLRLRLPRLANHMDHLQKISDGGGVEPPLPDVFTMQWFLTLYATWLPRDSLLRIWDLILLDGNEVLLLAALAIWDILQDRILSARSADDFYSCMGGGAGAIWESGDILHAKIVALGSAPELPRLRNIHRYKVTPPAPPNSAPMNQPPLHSAMQSMTKRGLRLFYSEDEGDSSDDGNKLALAMVIPRRDDKGTGDRLSLDIGALKRQYARLRERQRQAHVILAAACARHAAVGVPTSPTSLTVNNLLLGKTAIVSSRGRRLGPPPGAIPPTRQATSPSSQTNNETLNWNEENKRKTISRRNSLKWKDIKKDKKHQRSRKPSIDLDETGDGIIVSEHEANEMIASMRSRKKSSDSSSYSSHSSSSSDTSLCDDGENASDSDHDVHDRVLKSENKAKKLNAAQPVSKKSITKPRPIQNEPELVKQLDINTSLRDIDSIDEYLGSEAGAPLRTYIDEFESKPDQSNKLDLSVDYNPKVSPYTVQSLPLIENDDRLISPIPETHDLDTLQDKPVTKRINFNELSPLELSPKDFLKSARELSYTFRYHDSYTKLKTPQKMTRPPDIIDSLTKYPNFVPDLDLSERSGPKVGSRFISLGNKSVIISEDEPPIPLKIDKYFEHSPEFFGARFTDPNSSAIPSRRAAKRDCRIPKKPDSLTLKTSHNESLSKSVTERASSLPQSHSHGLIKSLIQNLDQKRHDSSKQDNEKQANELKPENVSPNSSKKLVEPFSPKEYIIQSGRKNSERALQIIQENSKILSRILTKQSISETKKSPNKIELSTQPPKNLDTKDKEENEKNKTNDLIFKESASDSLVRYRKKEHLTIENNNLTRSRPNSINDPSFLELHNKVRTKSEQCSKTPNEALGNKTDLYGWENKGFLAKCDIINSDDKLLKNREFDMKSEVRGLNETNEPIESGTYRHSYSEETRPSVTLPSTENKDSQFEHRRLTSEDYSYPLCSKYNDFVLSKASDICSKISNEESKPDSLLKTENSQVSDFANMVTSSISFTYEPSGEDSLIDTKTNSSDTLCQIASLEQVSTPISPKIFPNKEPATKEFLSDKSDRNKLETDGTCSAITSLLETDTLSSLSYPRTPSTGSYHPFPTRSLKMPKELGVKLGMYPKEPISSPPK